MNPKTFEVDRNVPASPPSIRYALWGMLVEILILVGYGILLLNEYPLVVDDLRRFVLHEVENPNPKAMAEYFPIAVQIVAYGCFVVAAFYGFMAYKLAKGKSWPAYVLTVETLIYLAGFWSTLSDLGLGEILMECGQFALRCWIIYQLFRSQSRAWRAAR